MPIETWQELVDAFAAGVYLLLGLVHFDLWRRQRGERGHLFLAGATAGALAVDLTAMALRYVEVGSPSLLPWLNNLGVAVAAVCLAELAAWLKASPPSRVGRGLEIGVLGLAAVAGLQLDARLNAVFMVACTALLVTAAARGLRGARGGEPHLRVFAGGVTFLILCLLVDVLMEQGVLPPAYGFPALGFVVLFLASAKVLADRSARERLELEALRRDLELRVEERTLELQEANRRLDEASRTDALTGLPNRREFIAVSAAEQQRSQRTRRPFSIVIGDLDNFKNVNDRFGHAAGDTVLRRVADTIRGSLRAQDFVARWGGEEFIFLLPETDQAGAATAAEAIRLAVAGVRVLLESTSVTVTLSLGAAEHRPSRTLDETLALADRALYRAKEEGRDRVVVGEP